MSFVDKNFVPFVDSTMWAYIVRRILWGIVLIILFCDQSCSSNCVELLIGHSQSF